MKTSANGTLVDTLRAHRIYDMLVRHLNLDITRRPKFVADMTSGSPLVDLVTAEGRKFVLLNQHGIWVVGGDPNDMTVGEVQKAYGATAKLLDFLLAHYLSGAPGPDQDADINRTMATPS